MIRISMQYFGGRGAYGNFRSVPLPIYSAPGGIVTTGQVLSYAKNQGLAPVTNYDDYTSNIGEMYIISQASGNKSSVTFSQAQYMGDGRFFVGDTDGSGQYVTIRNGVGDGGYTRVFKKRR